MTAPELTAEDVRNGWTPESFAAYHAERERAAKVHGASPVGGNRVTEFTRDRRPPIRHENALNFDPFKWGRRNAAR